MTSQGVVPATADRPIPTVRRSFLVAFAFASFGLWIATLTPVIVTLPLKVAELDPDRATQSTTLSIVLGIGAVFGILANPIFGRISDRTTWRIGMRRPWLVIGALISVVGAVLVGTGGTVAVVTAGWAVNQIGVNATMAVLLALLPDQVPSERRGMVSGLLGLSQALAAVVGTGVVVAIAQLSLTVAVVVPAVIALVFVTIAGVTLQDRRLDRADRPPLRLPEFVRSFWVDPRAHPDFAWAWISRFAIFMAISAVLNYQIFYLTSHVGISTQDATALVPAAIGIQTVAVLVTSLVFGRLSDRLRRRKVFVLGSALVSGTGLALIAFAPPNPSSVPLFLVAMVFVGVGQGTYFAVDLALVADVLPNRDADAAKDLGVLGMAGLIPQSIAPAIAPVFLAIPLLSMTGEAGQNYTALFSVGVLFAIVSGATILRVRGVR